MTEHHIRQAWTLTHPVADPITISLRTDGSVHMDGGNRELTAAGRRGVDQLLEKYALRGYWVTSETPPGQCGTCPTCGFCLCDNHTCQDTQ